MWSLTVLYLIMPFFCAPSWCIDKIYEKDEDGNLINDYDYSDGIWLDCLKVSRCHINQKLIYPYSRLPMAKPAFTASLGFLCLVAFTIIKIIRLRPRMHVREIIIRDTIFFGMVGAAFLDYLIALILKIEHYWADLLRPFIVIACYRTQLDFFILVVKNLKDSSVLLITMFVWVVFFALFGMYLFENTAQGIVKFDTFGKAFWNMFVCLTTENFPDVMLEATAVNTAFSLFFIVFILVGVFFLTSVLLAVIFDNYKRRLQT